MSISGKRILVVDDDVQVAHSMKMFLEMCGHSVHVAHSGERAITLAEDVRPDVVVLDIQMKGIDGIEVCKRLRSFPWGVDVQVLAITAWADPHAASRCFAAGFDRYFAKPVAPELIANAIISADLDRPRSVKAPYL